MVAYLSKSDASEGFSQIINFLNGSSIKYALTVNPNIYVSCIKQFWTTITVKQVNDVTRLQALVDTKKIMITEATIRDALHLDNPEGVDYLPNEEIFTELARMGYKKPSTKLTVETPLFEGMLVEQEIEEAGDAYEHVEEVTDGDDAHGDDSSAHGEVPIVTKEPSIPSPTPPTLPPQPPQDLPSTSQVAQALEITKLKRRVKKLEKRNKVRVLKLRRLQRVGTSQRVDTFDDTVMDNESNQGRMIAEMDTDDAVVLMDDKEEDKKVEEAKVDEIPAATLTATPVRVAAAPSRRKKGVIIRDLEEESTTSTIIPAKTKSKDKGKEILVEEPKPLKKKQQIEQDKQFARKLHAELNKDIDWDEAIDHVKLKAKEDPAIKRYQAIKRKPQTEAQARKNMMMYLKNVVGFKLDYFKGMSYDDIRPIFKAKFNSNVDFLLKTKEQMEEEENKAMQSINETPAQKAAKRRKLNREVEDLKRHFKLHHFIRDAYDKKLIQMLKIHTDDNVADLLTKAFDVSNFNKLDDLVGERADYVVNEGRSTDKIKVLNAETEGVSAAGETLSTTTLAVSTARSRMKRMFKWQKTNVDLEEEEQLRIFLNIIPDEEREVDYAVLDKRYP
uniref:Putative ribonuclease H-like domain-containing protein n=1 Tax=Tanacetum cinerariifolium TaxID=118510 RepID=A0A6L2NLJ1_TANCI|nr:putative ribonuclease H-like domain-containing protein [Tanacetum cinerariifolium]